MRSSLAPSHNLGETEGFSETGVKRGGVSRGIAVGPTRGQATGKEPGNLVGQTSRQAPGKKLGNLVSPTWGSVAFFE